MSDVLVIDYREPLQRLVSWFLTDRGVENVHVTDRADLKAVATGQHPKVVVVNSVAPLREIAEIVAEVHDYDGNPVSIVLHPKPEPGDVETYAELFLHDVNDPDALVKAVLDAMNGQIPNRDVPGTS